MSDVSIQHGHGAPVDAAPTPCGCHSRRWFAATTAPHGELRALGELEAQGFESYLPLLETKPKSALEPVRLLAVFPRYLFIAFDPAVDAYGAIYRTPWIGTLISGGDGRPIPLPVGVIEHLMERTGRRRVLDDRPQRAGMALGDVGRVLDGPLAGLEGITTMAVGERIRLLLAMFGASREIEFKRRSVVRA